jgi:hypothetical protein
MNRIIENYSNRKDIVFCKASLKNDFYEIPLCISEVLKSDEYCAFKLMGIAPNRKSHESFTVVCTIRHSINEPGSDAPPKAFEPEMKLKIVESDFDPERKNFGDLLAKQLKFSTRGCPFRNCQIQVDAKRSDNFTPVTVFENAMDLYIPDQNADHLYNFILDWPSRIALFKIPKKTAPAFMSYYFANSKTQDPFSGIS